MKSKKLLIALILTVITTFNMISPIYAANYSFDFTVTPTQVTAKPGDTITVNLGIANIDQETDGINAIQGNMSYDNEAFESVEIVSSDNKWNIALNKEENNPLKGNFVMTYLNGEKETGTVAILKAKIKSDTTLTTGTINFKDVCSSYGTTETAKINKTVTVNIEEQEPTNPEQPSEPQEPEQPTNPEQPGNTNPPVDNTNTDNGSTGQKPSTNNKNTSKAPSLPKAGLNSWIVIGIAVTTISAVIGYIKYKNIY